MARPRSHTEHYFLLDRAAFKLTDVKTAKTNAPARKPAGEALGWDIDDVFEEPSRRPF